ncbi:pectate lyase [uncultured Draconibacterium sp.]|uniref:pectate lyase n=1 Tax=uncultured Draconibacterium sp. TaxID=1573823 RepID=UPI0032603CCA
MTLFYRIITLFIAFFTTISVYAQNVKLSEATWHGAGCYKIEMTMGTVYFEKDSGVSGFKSFIDSEGNDWIASYMEPGPNGDFRGFPNSIDNFGHAGRNSGSTTKIVNGITEGDVVILESSNDKFTFQYWFFADRVAIKVLKSEGEYCFLLECVAGGTADAEDYFVTADGKKHIPTEDGEFDDFTPEWFYLGDPKSDYVLFLAKSPEDDAPNENHRQIRPNGQHNMDLYSFGRTGKEHKYQVYGMSGNEHICVIGFAPKSRTHNEMIAHMEAYLAQPFTSGVRMVKKWGSHVLDHDGAWYASDDARTIADNVIQYQSKQGGWPKSTDLSRPPLTPGDIPKEGGRRANSLDNDATTVPMEFLARVIEATGEEKYIKSFNKGVDYLIAAQYPNGGWPQFWPLRGDKYYSRITFNDEAMIRVMNLLSGVAKGNKPFSFIDKKRQKLATEAVELGLECILNCQVKQNGKLAAWCAQHDEHTLEPAWARAYEPPSLSGSESVGVLRYLMSIQNPSPEVVEAVEAGVSWLKSVAIKSVRLDKVRNPDGRNERILTPDENAPLLWARFYELETNRPLYLDRDSKFRYNYSEVGYERRSGYDYHGFWASSLLKKDYPIWKAKYGTTADQIPASTLILEAEEGKFSGSIDRHSCWHNVMLSDASHSTHSGRGAVDTRNEKGSYVEVTYKATNTGMHRVSVRYTHIKIDPRPGELLVNGKKVAKLKLKQSEALPAWKTESVEVELQKGMNTIRLAAINDGGLPNTDYIKVTDLHKIPEGRIPRVKVLEAEDGKYTGKEDHHSCWEYIAQNQAAHSGFTGEGYVDTENKVGSYIQVEFNAPEAGQYNLGIRYVHGKPDIRPAELRVNGKVVNPSVSFMPTSAWTDWTTVIVPVELNAGSNIVRLTALGKQGLVNTDHFSLSQKR